MRKGSGKLKLSSANEDGEKVDEKENGAADADVSGSTGEEANANGDAEITDDESDSKTTLKKAKQGKKNGDENDEPKDDESGDDFDKLKKEVPKKRKFSVKAKEASSSKRKKTSEDGDDDEKKDSEQEDEEHGDDDGKDKDFKVKDDVSDASDYEASAKKKGKAKSSPKKRKSTSKVVSKRSKTPKRKASKPEPEAEEEEEEEDEEEDQAYEVEKVVDMKESRGKREFKIRWKGYKADSDTWEAEDGLNCPDAIKAYLKAHPAKAVVATPSPAKKASKKKVDKKRSSKGAKESEDESEDEKEYEVDKVLELHNKKNGKREFLIRWKGFSSKDDTWEPEEHLNCGNLIEKFMEKVDRAKNMSEKELRPAPQHTERFTLATSDSGRRLSRRGVGKQRQTYHDFE